MTRSLADITVQLANLRANLPDDLVKSVARFRAEKWFRFAEKLEEVSPESELSIELYKERATNWAKVATS